jgi:bifunctional non-homologous end joining protein LigD
MSVDPATVRPMLATTGAAPLESPEFVYEPKYDGIRAIAVIAHESIRRAGSAAGGPAVHLWSRLGNDKTSAFPAVVDALQQWARGLARPVVLDGEVVALDAHGTPVGFQHLQRIQMHDAPIAFIVFDVLRDGADDLRDRPLRERRARLETLLDGLRNPQLRISEQAVRLAVQIGQAITRLAQAEAGAAPGVCHRRLDRPAGIAPLLRRSAARRL